MQIPFPRVLRILQKRVSRKPINRGGVLKKGSLTNIPILLMYITNITKKQIRCICIFCEFFDRNDVNQSKRKKVVPYCTI